MITEIDCCFSKGMIDFQFDEDLVIMFKTKRKKVVRNEKKKEWYTLTETGKRVLMLMEEIIKTVEEEIEKVTSI